jgi:hypothetical protein
LREAGRVKTKTRRPGQRGKSIDERIAYALGHRVRIEILRRLLSEGAQTADAIAAVVVSPARTCTIT